MLFGDSSGECGVDRFWYEEDGKIREGKVEKKIEILVGGIVVVIGC
jgi:hypothetical protein